MASNVMDQSQWKAAKVAGFAFLFSTVAFILLCSIGRPLICDTVRYMFSN